MKKRQANRSGSRRAMANGSVLDSVRKASAATSWVGIKPPEMPPVVGKLIPVRRWQVRSAILADTKFMDIKVSDWFDPEAGLDKFTTMMIHKVWAYTDRSQIVGNIFPYLWIQPEGKQFDTTENVALRGEGSFVGGRAAVGYKTKPESGCAGPYSKTDNYVFCRIKSNSTNVDLYVEASYY